MTKDDLRPVRCRFAPSPTGELHLGSARTALFNYLFARANNGHYILRIEDTDRERSTTEAVETIVNGLDWLGLTHDEGPFYQSERFDVCARYAKQLLASGHAYRCFCSAEELSAMRDAQREAKQRIGYNGKHRPAERTPEEPELPTASDEKPFVIRLRTPDEGNTVFHDLIVGDISTANEEIDDFIIYRSDGTPTYNFIVVVDDIDMQISHVIRGMDHISNTPKQVLIYEALGAMLPVFAHTPMILGPDKKKLSKRHGATSVFEYKKEGYIPDAFVNYLARLGWSHGDQEIFSRAELESCFSLDNVNKSDAVFDFVKCLWVNGEHMKTLPITNLRDGVLEFLIAEGVDTSKVDDSFDLLLENLRERAKTLKEMADACRWYFVESDALDYDEKAVKKHLKPAIKEAFSALYQDLLSLDPYTDESLETLFQTIAERFDLKLGKIAQPVRIAVTGSSVSPPIYTVLRILGREESTARMRRARELFPE